MFSTATIFIALFTRASSCPRPLDPAYYVFRERIRPDEDALSHGY